MRSHRLLFAALALLLLASLAPAADAPPRPNFLIIFADDLGFSDIACYGGEVETPNLDRLAQNGLRFTQFYNTARCWPSRAALLTGYYAQQVRRDTLPGIVSGGAGARPHWAPLLPVALRPLGYRSYHSGKWHIDGETLENGFDHSYRLDDHNRNFSPQTHYEDGKKLPPVAPDSGYYTTTAMADHAIKCLKEHADKYQGRPFFSYLAFTVPHFPLQAPAQDVKKYLGKFREGWDVLRQQRLERMTRAGIVTCGLSPRTPGVPAWETLSDADKDKWDAHMAVHAAMVDRMDQEIGRVLEQLRAMGAFENTVVLFLSDNGASAEKLVRGDGHDPTAPPGSARTFMCLEPPWANLANAPLRRSKIFVHEGGIATPLIVHWPAGLRARGELRHNPGHLIDVAPTFLELAGGRWPDSGNGTPAPPRPGKSLVPVFTKDNSVRHDYFWWSHSGNRAVRVGDWKLVSEGDGPWELYDLAHDRGEATNLAAKHPDRARDLEQEWKKHLDEFLAHAKSDGKANVPTKKKGKKTSEK